MRLRVFALLVLASVSMLAQPKLNLLVGGYGSWVANNTASGTITHSVTIPAGTIMVTKSLQARHMSLFTAVVAPQVVFPKWWFGGGLGYGRVISSPTVTSRQAFGSNTITYQMSASKAWKPGLVLDAGRKFGESWAVQTNFGWARTGLRIDATAPTTRTVLSSTTNVDLYQFLGGIRYFWPFLGRKFITDLSAGPVWARSKFQGPQGQFEPNKVGLGANIGIGYLIGH